MLGPLEIRSASAKSAHITVDLGKGKILGLNVSMKQAEGESAHNICRINVTVQARGPRGGFRPEGVSIGYVEFDTRKPIVGPFGSVVR